MRWKPIFAVGFAALLAMGSAAGCAPEQTNESLTVWVADPILEQKQFSYAMFRFQQDHPDVDVHFAEGPEPVDFRRDSADDYKTYINDTLPAYTYQMRVEVMAHSGPDLIIFNRDTFPNLYKTMASGAFAPLDPFIEGDETYQCGATGLKEPFTQAVLDAGIYQGKQYFMPLAYSIPTIFSTKETVRKYGGDPERPMSHDELMSLLERAAGSGDEAYLMARENGWEEDISYAPQRWFCCTQWDGLLSMDYDRQTVVLDRDKLENRIHQYQTLFRYQDSCQASPINIHADLSSGRTVCELSESMELTVYRAEYVYYNTDPYLSPLLNADNEVAAYLERGAAINAYSKNQQNAYEFLKYAMQAQGYSPENVVYAKTPVNEAALEKFISYSTNPNITLNYLAARMPDEDYWKILEWAQNIGEVYIDTGLDEQMKEWFQPYFRGEQSFDSCYQTMENALEIMISE